MRKLLAIGIAVVAVLPAWSPGVRAEVPQTEPPQPDAIFARAKDAWRARTEPPFVRFGLRERYSWRDRLHDSWWQASYRSSDRTLALRRIVVPDQEDARLRGIPITIDIRLHEHPARADALDTNPNADAFPILDPQIEPNASFGMLRREPKSTLVGAAAVPFDESAPRSATLPTPAPLTSPSPAPSAAVPEPGQTPLRELVRVEAVARDYRIELAGTERIRDAATYHLTLTPLRDPRVYRLRDLWVDTQTYVTVQLALAGLFDGKPYEDARWLVSYVPIDGRYYVEQIKTDDQLRFGIDRFVSGLQFDFVQYDFPADIPTLMFEHYL